MFGRSMQLQRGTKAVDQVGIKNKCTEQEKKTTVQLETMIHF